MIAPAGLRRGLEDLGAEALLVVGSSARDPDVAPWVGPVHLGRCFVVASAEGPPRLGYLTAMEREEAAATGLDLLHPEALDVLQLSRDLPTQEAFLTAVLERALALCGLAPGRIAVAGHGPVGVAQAIGLRLAAAGWEPVPANHLSLLLRKGKDAGQLAAARRAAAGTATALRRVAELLAAAAVRDGELWLEGEPLRVARLRVEVARTLAAFELEQPEGNLIAPGEEGAAPHTAGTPERVLRPGESLVVDLFPRGWVYADCTRTFCVGEAPAPLAAAHAAALAVLERAYDKLQPHHLAQGLRAFSLQDSACGLLKKAGYPTPLTDPGTTVGYVHNLGHGVGFELHEYPSFRREAGEEGKLAPGDLLTLEPGLYDAGAGYAVRLEDLLYLGDGGPENLTPLPYELDPRAWQ